ncbi:MAG TPA: ABC transporter permease [Rhizomicrobium sp.]|nr:ABC transporter permease [Rhizomicrobium sp.]
MAQGISTHESYPHLRITRIEPSARWRFLDMAEIWRYRELLYFLARRDIQIRYKQTAIGILWVVVQPVASILVFSLFFGNLAKIPSNGVPYPLFVFAALLPWQVFSRAMMEASNSLVTDQRLVSRVYFPRILVPLSSVIAALFDFSITFLLFLGMMLYYDIYPSIAILSLPIFLFLMVATAVGVGFWLAPLNIEYRDVTYILPFLTQIWMFLTPVVYPSTLVPEQWRFLYGLNPLVGVVEGFRWALLGTGPGPSPMLFVSGGVAVVLMLTGIVWFRRRERTFTDAVGSGGR